MIADDLLIASSSSSKIKCIPLLISSDAETPELNTSISSNLDIKGKYAQFSCTYSKSTLPITSILFSELVSVVGAYGLYKAFYNCTNLTSVSFPKLTTISGYRGMAKVFYGCTNLTSVSFPKLTTVTYPNTAFYQAGPSTLTIHLPKALSSLGITNDDGSNSSNYCKFAYDL